MYVSEGDAVCEGEGEGVYVTVEVQFHDHTDEPSPRLTVMHSLISSASSSPRMPSSSSTTSIMGSAVVTRIDIALAVRQGH